MRPCLHHVLLREYHTTSFPNRLLTTPDCSSESLLIFSESLSEYSSEKAVTDGTEVVTMCGCGVVGGAGGTTGCGGIGRGGIYCT